MCRESRAHRPGQLRTHRSAIAGFTLIEMMIVVALIAILSAIVLPSYQDSVRKARRTDARSALTTIAQLMERWNTEKNMYFGATLGNAATDLYPATSESKYYTLSLSTSDAPPKPQTFKITATPVGGQAADPCGAYTLDQAGKRDAALPVAQCW
jgi:type IV pilus assembly protein PilE